MKQRQSDESESGIRSRCSDEESFSEDWPIFKEERNETREPIEGGERWKVVSSGRRTGTKGDLYRLD